MDFIETVILGVIQGIAEFLPISSSAHLIIFRDLFHIGEAMDPSMALAFDLALHFGTLLAIILYFVNERNVKTESSMKSIIIVLVILAVIIFGMTIFSRIAGFGYESFEEINMFSYDVNIDFTNIAIAIILIGLIGATVDSSIAISSALFEVYENNKKLSKKELFNSGINIGKDILCTTANTLLFAFLGEFMTLLIWFESLHYSLGEIINAKTFCAEMIRILFSGMGCVLVIPITAYITVQTIFKLKKNPYLMHKEL